MHKIVNCLNFVGLYYYFALYLFTPRNLTSEVSPMSGRQDVAARAECRQESLGGKDCAGPPPARGHGVVADKCRIKHKDN